MLEISYILNLGQLLKMAPNLKKYLWQKLKPKKQLGCLKVVFEKLVHSSFCTLYNTDVQLLKKQYGGYSSINWEEYHRRATIGKVVKNDVICHFMLVVMSMSGVMC